MTSEYNEWYKITWKRPKPEQEATLNQEWYSASCSWVLGAFALSSLCNAMRGKGSRAGAEESA
eukprot:1035947-Rhodomonas_salina.1